MPAGFRVPASTVSGTTNASDLTTGTVALARGGTGADLSATGGSGQVLKQTSAGGAVSVAAIAAGDLPSHTHTAANITDFSSAVLTAAGLQVSGANVGIGAAPSLAKLDVQSSSGAQQALRYSAAVYALATVNSSGHLTQRATGGRYYFRNAANNADVLGAYESGGNTYWAATTGNPLYVQGGNPILIVAGGSFVQNFYSDRILTRVPMQLLGETVVASTTQSQGQGALTGKNFVRITTCANANDTITLASAGNTLISSGLPVWIKNAGAETAQIFPASGQDLGQGTNNPTTLAAGASTLFYATSTTTWEQY